MPADPRIPHLLGITLSTDGVANTLVIAINKTTRERQIKRTNSDKVVVFDAADFTTLYGLDIVQFNNVGSSVGMVENTITNEVLKFIPYIVALGAGWGWLKADMMNMKESIKEIKEVLEKINGKYVREDICLLREKEINAQIDALRKGLKE